MFQSQQESINNCKKMIALLLDKIKKKTMSPKTKTSSSKSRGKKEEGESLTSKNIGNKNNFGYENPESSYEE